MKTVARALVLLAVVGAAVASVAEARSWSWLGVRIRDLSELEMEEISSRHGIREGFGVVIVEVIADTPAARAGLKSGDIVVAFGQRPVVETRLLQRLIAAAPVDRDTDLTVLRAEGRRALKVRLTSMPTNIAGERVAAEFGFALREPLPPAALGQTRLTRPPVDLGGDRPESTAPTVGVVARGSAAEKAGLEVGDVIVAVGERPVVTGDAARQALAEREPDRPLALTVRRGERRLALTLCPQGDCESG
jgi:serine protease Do